MTRLGEIVIFCWADLDEEGRSHPAFRPAIVTFDHDDGALDLHVFLSGRRADRRLVRRAISEGCKLSSPAGVIRQRVRCDDCPSGPRLEFWTSRASLQVVSGGPTWGE